VIYLSLQLLPWLAAIFLVGAATALWARVETPRTKIAPWLVWCALAFCVAAALAALHAAQGRAGVWLETALAGFAIYVAGTAAGASRRKNGFAEHDKWALGLVPAALIWFAANLISGPSIEADLAKAVRAKINSAHARAEFSVEGRDVRISADAPNRDALVDAINEVAGVRLVATANSSASAVSDSGDTAALDAKEAPAQKAPNEAGRMADAAVETLAHAQADQTGGPTPKAEEELRPAPRARAKDRAKAAAAELKAVPRSGELDVATCQNALNNTLVIDKIQFRIGSASILRASAYVLDRLAAFLRRCPTAKVEIGGHTDNIGDGEDNQALSQRRAEAVLRYLNGEGVAAARMTAIGYGAKKPIAPNDDDEGRAENRRIEMLLK
jgi:outer membrane protein OmpA-like peptidoglycan-associated protein